MGFKFEKPTVLTTNHARGRWAETKAKWILRLKGYRLLKERFKTPVGEIDLIMRHGCWIIFIEVKQRQTQAVALEAVTLKQQQRISQAAHWYLARQAPQFHLNVRFDVIAMTRWQWFHLQNAWSVR